MISFVVFFLMIRRPTRSPLFPYTTLFRSLHLLGALDRPTAGRVVFQGEDLFSRGEPALDRSSPWKTTRSEEHTSELQSRFDLVCRLLLEKKKTHDIRRHIVEEFFVKPAYL